MLLPEGMTRFLLAAALWIGVSAIRRVLLRGSRSDAARTFAIEPRPPQLLLAIYLIGRVDAARAEAGASQAEEETNLLSRIGAMFGFGGRAAG